MDWLDRMNAAIDYIEDNLTGEIDYKLAAKAACCPDYHFQRMFAFISEVTLSEYIRRRRLTLAAFELQQSNKSVIEVAQTFGYQSHASFTRAFRELHGISPITSRQPGVKLKAYPRMSFRISITGRTEMSYRIEKKPGFTAVGFKHNVYMDHAYSYIPKIWQEASQNGIGEKLLGLLDKHVQQAPKAILGILAGGNWGRADTFFYYTAAPYEQEAPADMEKLIIPQCQWVVFEPQTLADFTSTWKRLYTDWLPTSDYVLSDIPAVECYYPSGHYPQNELWIPIRREEDENGRTEKNRIC